MNRKVWPAILACLVIAVLALTLATVALTRDDAAPTCEETSWAKGPVTTERPVNLKDAPDADAWVLERIGEGETLTPTRKHKCDGEPAWLAVEYNGKSGWIRRGAVRLSDADSD